MRFSACLKSSKHCLPSPDGRFVATLFGSVVNVRAVDSLEVVNVVRLPQDFAGPVLGFQWSPSSRLLLVAAVDQIHVVAAVAAAADGEPADFRATIRHPVPPAARPTFVAFSPTSTAVCVFSSLGLKLAVYDLRAAKAVEVAHPKFFTAAAARSGFSFRPGSHHLALLTRTDGKDMVSIHDPTTRGLQRAWYPDTIDAQGLRWSPDGRWLLVWESAGQGHKVIFYTAEGQSLQTWCGPRDPAPEQRHFALGTGVRRLAFSADGRQLAVGDGSRYVYVLSTASSVRETMRLAHPTAVVPSDTVQVWQEQVNVAQAGPALHTFLRAAQHQAIAPPPARPRDGVAAAAAAEPSTGCSSLLFDPCSPLLATALEEAPSTLWIWDLQAAELRAVLVFHARISAAAWHPTARETLLVQCEGEAYHGVAFVWDPLSEGPRTIDFAQHLPPPVSKPAAGGATTTASATSTPTSPAPRRSYVAWLGATDPAAAPAVFYSDAAHYLLASLAESDDEAPPWWRDGRGVLGWKAAHIDDGARRREESPLELVPAGDGDGDGDGSAEDDGDGSELEDTFHYKR